MEIKIHNHSSLYSYNMALSNEVKSNFLNGIEH